MRFVVQMLLGERNEPARALIMDSYTGQTCELMAPETDPVPGPTVTANTNAPERALAAALEVALANMTELHPRRGPAYGYPTLLEALEAADRDLAGGFSRVARTDLSETEVELLHNTIRQLQSLSGDLNDVMRQRLNHMPAFVADRQRDLDRVLEWLEEFRTRDLQPRTEATMPDAAASAHTRLATLNLPALLRAELEEFDVYTLADVLASKQAPSVFATDLIAADTIFHATVRAKLDSPDWLVKLASEAQCMAAAVDDLTQLSAPVKNALKQARVRRVGDLVQRSRQQLLALENLGPSRVQEIETALAAEGLTLAAANRPTGSTNGSGGIAQVVNVIPSGAAFVKTPSGDELYVPKHEAARVGTLEPGWTVRFERTTPTDKKPSARGLALAVPDVLGKRLSRARELLERQGLVVVVDGLAGRSGHAPSTEEFRVHAQGKPPGAVHKAGEAVLLHVEAR